jgi:hypothetical protein
LKLSRRTFENKRDLGITRHGGKFDASKPTGSGFLNKIKYPGNLKTIESTQKGMRGNTSIGQVGNRMEYVQKDVLTNQKYNAAQRWEFDNNILDIGHNGMRLSKTGLNTEINITKSDAQESNKKNLGASVTTFFRKLFSGGSK